MDLLQQIPIALLTALFGAGVSYLTARSTAANQVSDAAAKLAKSYGTRLDEVESFARRQSRYVRYLLDGIRTLHAQLADNGLCQVWTPEDIDVVCPPE